MIMTVAAAVFVFGLLVLVHELGHFITAKFTGMKVDEFALGFGPQLLKKRIGETVYSIRAIPLGGFNDIAGMDPADNKAGDRGFCEKPVLSRMIVILAGAGMNFILPIILFFGIYATIGIGKPAETPVIGAVIEGRSAESAGLMAGDKILSVNGENIMTWENFSDKIKSLEPNQSAKIIYERNSQVGELSVTPEYDEQAKRNFIGVQSAIEYERQSIPVAFEKAVTNTKEIMFMMISMLVDIFKAPTQAELAGPLGIAQMAGQVAESGFVPLLNFAALLSLNLGIINLLPVPALDGGHFVNLVIEAVRGKPLGTKALAYTQRIGIALLLLLMVFATKNDIVRLFFN